MNREREAFKAWFKKGYLGIDNLANRGDEGAIARRNYAYIGWQAAKAQAVPDGFVVVPKEPTKAMLIAADNCEIDGKVTAHNIYKAMIEAQEQANDK